ncbi:hypothetical protein [Reichenbachiella versicolor]|uniref:hypothetical protein n=1 Tax=Reichenbachiella versicolor TaxID=1821036 RepID=UPI000D6E541A|nr:hypothetical protein [Reichenbachiella versicolor]
MTSNLFKRKVNHFTIQKVTCVVMILCSIFLNQLSYAQFWGSAKGTDRDRYTINDDNSNHYSYLRLQTSGDRGWNMVNQGDLWWGFAANGLHSDRGNRKMILTRNGNLGIGIDNPTEKLHVAGNIRTNGGEYQSWGAIKIHPDADNTGDDEVLFLNSAGQENMRVHHNGYVGIGTNSPNHKFHVYANGAVGLFESSWNQAYLRVSTNEGIHNRVELANRPGGNLALWVAGVGDALTILKKGNVGIRNTNPIADLDVAGSLRATGSINIGTSRVSSSHALEVRKHVDNWQAVFGSPNGPHVLIAHGQSKDGMDINTRQNNSSERYALRVRNNQLTHLYVRDDGNVGVGTLTPNHKLEIAGDVYAKSFVTSAASFPDYVFTEEYDLMELSEVETFVKKHHHLPNMPSESEVVDQGMNLNDITIQSVENIESIFLHLIKLEKEMVILKNENKKLKEKLDTL